MPRTKIKYKPVVEFLSILDDQAKVDSALDPKLDADLLMRMYRVMLAARRLDERCIALQRQGRIGTYGPCRGQEASMVAAGVVLETRDWFAPSFREMPTMLARGWPMVNYIQFWGGFEEGNMVPEGVNDLPIAVPVASQCLHAVGLAWAQKLKKTGGAAIGFLGDGGTSEGDFHEAMNFAATYSLPVVIIINNNQYAISHPRGKQTRSETLAQKAVAYGINGLQVDGNDILACYVAIRESIDKARNAFEPTLIEAVTYRLSVHTTADDPTKYRTTNEVDQWEKKEPLIRFTRYLRDRGILNDKLLAELEADIAAEIKSAVEQYERAAQNPDPLDAFRFVYAELPPELEAQRAEFEACLTRERSHGAH